MILIKKIDTIEVPSDQYPIQSFDNFKELPYRRENDYLPQELKVTQEIVRGITYRTLDGREICIGMSKQAQDAIGLPYEALIEALDRADRLHSENISMSHSLKKRNTKILNLEKDLMEFKKTINSLKFWDRFKFLIRGKM